MPADDRIEKGHGRPVRARRVRRVIVPTLTVAIAVIAGCDGGGQDDEATGTTGEAVATHAPTQADDWPVGELDTLVAIVSGVAAQVEIVGAHTLDVADAVPLQEVLENLPWGETTDAYELVSSALLARVAARGPAVSPALHRAGSGIGARLVSVAAGESRVTATSSRTYLESAGLEQAVHSGRAERADAGQGAYGSLEIEERTDRYVCWDPGAFEQRSTEASGEAVADIVVDGERSRMTITEQVRYSEFTNGDVRWMFRVSVDGHVMELDSSRQETHDSDDDLVNRPWHGDPTDESFSETDGGYRYTMSYTDGSSMSFECPGRCTDGMLEAAALWLDKAVTSLMLTVALEAANWQDEGEGMHADDAYCLNAEVEPDEADLEPAGDEARLTVTVTDWRDELVTPAIVEARGAVLGTVTPRAVPTGPDGQARLTYVSGDPGVDLLEIVVGHSFYTLEGEDAPHAEMRVGAGDALIEGGASGGGVVTRGRWYSCDGIGGQWLGEVEVVTPSGTLAGTGSFTLPDDPEPGDATVARWSQTGTLEQAAVAMEFEQRVVVGGTDEQPTLRWEAGTLTVTLTAEGITVSHSDTLDAWEEAVTLTGLEECRG